MDIEELNGVLSGRDAILIGNSGLVGRLPVEKLAGADAAIVGLNAAPALLAPKGVPLDYHLLFDWRFLHEKSELVLPHLSASTVCIWGDHVQPVDSRLPPKLVRVQFLGYDGFSYNISFGAFSGHTVAVPALQLCYHLRPRRVYLLGVDLNYGRRNPRFYQERRGKDVELHVKHKQIHSVLHCARALEGAGIDVVVVGDESNLRGHLVSVAFEDLLSRVGVGRGGVNSDETL